MPIAFSQKTTKDFIIRRKILLGKIRQVIVLWEQILISNIDNGTPFAYPLIDFMQGISECLN